MRFGTRIIVHSELASLTHQASARMPKIRSLASIVTAGNASEHVTLSCDDLTAFILTLASCLNGPAKSVHPTLDVRQIVLLDCNPLCW